MSKQDREEDEMTKTTFRMQKSLLKDVKHYAIDHDTSDTDVFNQAVKEFMTKHYDEEERKREKR